FGLAQLAGEGVHLTRTGEVVGTPLYMSPEQVRGTQVGPASDVYSLGATLYEALTLRPPLEAKEPSRLAAAVLAEEPPRPRALVPTIPKDLETVVLRALEKDPARRYASAGAMARDLVAFAEGRAIRARRTPWVVRFPRLVRRYPARAAAALLLALLAAGSTWLLTRPSLLGVRSIPEATVLLDGENAGATPMRDREVALGGHRVEVRR